MTSFETFLKLALCQGISVLYLIPSFFNLNQYELGFPPSYWKAEGCFCGCFSLPPPSLPEFSRDIHILGLLERTLFLLWLAEATHGVLIFVLPFFDVIAFLAELPRKTNTIILSLHCSYGHKTKFWPVGCKQKDNVLASRILKRQQK